MTYQNVKQTAERWGVSERRVTLLCRENRVFGAKKDKKNTSRELKLAKIIIQIIDENYIMDLKSEHIIPESVGTSIVYKCGNIIPVINDRYADKEIKKKLDLYKQDEVINASIKKFLEFNPKEDNIEGIVENRTRQIAENYWGIFEELRNECLK